METFFVSFWEPGNIVKLKEPYVPSLIGPDNLLKEHIIAVLTNQKFLDDFTNDVPAIIRKARIFQEWPGFTHGIIVQVLSGSLVSLHLYDPSNSIIYLTTNGFPIYVDFSRDELIPYKWAKEIGYHSITDPDSIV